MYWLKRVTSFADLASAQNLDAGCCCRRAGRPGRRLAMGANAPAAASGARWVQAAARAASAAATAASVQVLGARKIGEAGNTFQPIHWLLRACGHEAGLMPTPCSNPPAGFWARGPWRRMLTFSFFARTGAPPHRPLKWPPGACRQPTRTAGVLALGT